MGMIRAGLELLAIMYVLTLLPCQIAKRYINFKAEKALRDPVGVGNSIVDRE